MTPCDMGAWRSPPVLTLFLLPAESLADIVEDAALSSIPLPFLRLEPWSLPLSLEPLDPSFLRSVYLAGLFHPKLS